MNIDTVIEQIRSLVPAFADNVAGGAAYAQGIDAQVWLPTPAAYVVPLEEDATENLDKTGYGLRQMITERIGVIVQLDNSLDRRGQAAAAQLDTFRSEIFSAILNWNPDNTRAVQGLFYSGGERLGIDRARYFYQFTFSWVSQWTHKDGWQPPAGVPLTTIDATYADQIDGEVLVQQTITIPQS